MIFVVGNSRSGTHLVAKILGNNNKIHYFDEIHFFEELWVKSDKGVIISRQRAIEVAQKLLAIIGANYFQPKLISTDIKVSENIVDSIIVDKTSEKVFESVLLYLSKKNGASIPLDKTPRNIFYIEDILEVFSEVKIINMVRNPRSVLASQKNKWRRYYLGSRNIPLSEHLRAFINYHPLVIAWLWNSSISYGVEYSSNENMHTIKYEDLIAYPESTVRDLCKFLRIDFSDDMLLVPQVGSSQNADSSNLGISKEVKKDGILNSAEIYISEKVTAKHRAYYGYGSTSDKPNIVLLCYYIITLPIKLAISFLMNISRMKNIFESIKKRLRISIY